MHSFVASNGRTGFAASTRDPIFADLAGKQYSQEIRREARRRLEIATGGEVWLSDFVGKGNVFQGAGCITDHKYIDTPVMEAMKSIIL